jgi:hypothetical protein
MGTAGLACLVLDWHENLWDSQSGLLKLEIIDTKMRNTYTIMKTVVVEHFRVKYLQEKLLSNF